MITSLALIFLSGLLMGSIFKKLKLPSLLGMIITGLVLSPYALNLLDPALLALSPDIRQLALIIILTRAGLSLDIGDLKKVGRPAILLCFIPASFEILGVILIGPRLLDISILDAAIMGCVLAAVSPAVVVPRMIKLMEEGYGKEKGIPQMILAGASVDDIFVIILFTAFTSLATGSEITVSSFTQIPISIISGIIIGIISGIGIIIFFQKFHMSDTVKILVLISVSGLLIALENVLEGVLPLSGLLTIMSIGATLYQKYPLLADRLSVKYKKLWVVAEIMLFVLVGASVDLQYALSSGLAAVGIVVGALLFRMVGVFVCVLNTKLTLKERLFCMIAYTPKATVQAAIGSIPLAMGLANGQVILTVAVLSILITAPFGAIGIDRSYKKLLANSRMYRLK